MLRTAAFAVTLALAIAGLRSVAGAVEIDGHTPPHLLKQGTTTKSTAPGSVTVQVLVPATGAASVGRVIKSTNHADDAAALEVARSSTYAPAVNAGKPNTEFFDYIIKFTGAGVAAAPAGSLAAYETMIHSGQYAGAEAGLTTYLSSHPSDTKAQLDLALADTFSNDLAGAAALFAKVEVIPAAMKPAARRALYETATADVRAKKYDEALVYAKKAVAVMPDYVSYAALGAAAIGSGDAPGAVSAFEKSRSLASSGSAKERATIDVDLVSAYLATSQPDKAKASSDEAKGLDASANVGGAFGQYYADQAKKAEAADDYAAAATAYETAAAQDSADAVTLDTDAAFEYLKMKTVDNAHARADAEKALAIDPADAGANFAEGIALANSGHTPEAIAALTKADATANAKGLTALATQIETNLKKLSAPK